MNGSRQQIMIELTLRKIFEEMIIKDCKIEQKGEQKKLIVKDQYRHEYKVGDMIVSFIELVRQNVIVI